MARTLTEPEKVLVQQVILPVIAIGKDGSFRPVGTCWIFALLGEREALAFSATHIFEEIVRSEERHEKYHPSVPDILRPVKPRPISLALNYLKAIYRTSDGGGVLIDIQTVYRDGSLDLAVCHLVLPENVPSKCSFKLKLAIYSGPIQTNTEVMVVSYGGMEKTWYFADERTQHSFACHFHQLNFIHGQCTGYFSKGGPRGPSGPCFEVDVSTQPGMSGGPVIYKAYGDLFVGCGVVSRGSSFGENDTSMACSLWPAYAFDLRIQDEVGNAVTFLDIAKHGLIDDKADGPSHYRQVVRKDGNGLRISWID